MLMFVVVAHSGCDLFPMLPPIGTTVNAGKSFTDAGRIAYDTNDMAVFNGNIQSSDPDMFDLGPMAAGDRIMVTVNASAGSQLDPNIAVFDDDEDVFSVNDDIDFEGGNFNSKVDNIVKQAADHYYLGIARFSQAAVGGSYVATIEISRGAGITAPPVQTLLLNFAGGPLTINGEGSFDLSPFDAGDIDAAYAGETAAIKRTIVETVEENFANTGIVIVVSDDNPKLVEGTFSTIHFGAFSGTKFGIADDVDIGNLDRCDDAIIFTERFDDPFAEQPSITGIGVAIGNVAAHEAGHLLGLHHVADISALMDNTGSASTLLADQDFKTAPLSPSIFPLGNQNDQKIFDRVIPAP
ncbi:MAG: matrixin family metalloprotease [Planctomycetes bacterium]|nr:matrixin family metalloprotease [Planctomycetota bacterium]